MAVLMRSKLCGFVTHLLHKSVHCWFEDFVLQHFGRRFVYCVGNNELNEARGGVPHILDKAGKGRNPVTQQRRRLLKEAALPTRKRTKPVGRWAFGLENRPSVTPGLLPCKSLNKPAGCDSFFMSFGPL